MMISCRAKHNDNMIFFNTEKIDVIVANEDGEVLQVFVGGSDDPFIVRDLLLKDILEAF